MQCLCTTAEWLRTSYSLGLDICPSVCPSIRLSVTLLTSIKMAQAKITKSSLSAAPKTIDFCNKISSHCVKELPSNVNVKKGYP